MIWMELDTWIVIAAVLSAMSCALLGNFLVLKKMSMMGDAISHAVLPGLAMAFLLTQSRDSLPMFIGAAIVGILTALFSQFIHQFGKVEQNASMGVVFTSLFAVGLILIVRAANTVDLDPGCVLYGAIEFIPLYTTNVFGFEIPTSIINLFVVFIIDIGVIILLFKELNLSGFDPALGTTLGFNSHVLHYILMTMIAITTVAAFESVGSILVIAMLIIPAAVAQLFTRRLSSMIVVSLVVAIISAAGGHVSAITIPGFFGFTDTNTSGMMAVVAGLIFFLSLFLSPGQGVIIRMIHTLNINLKSYREDSLGILYRKNELEEGKPVPSEEMKKLLIKVNPLLFFIALLQLKKKGKLSIKNKNLLLTEKGLEAARSLVRTHRLWESYLFNEGSTSMKELHTAAHQLEHVTTPELQESLAVAAEGYNKDPMGKEIPG